MVNAFALPASCSRYWATHCDLGVPLRGAAQSLIGAERAREMLTNVLLPFMLALGEHTGDSSVSDWAVTSLRHAPAGGANRLIRSMRDDVLRLAAKIRAHDCRAPPGAYCTFTMHGVGRSAATPVPWRKCWRNGDRYHSAVNCPGC